MGVKITNLPSTAVNNADYIPVANTTSGTKKVLMSDVLAAAEPTVDSALSASSTNPVQNSAIYAALAAKQDTLTAGANITITNNVISATGGGGGGGGSVTVDSALSNTSENPVQNKVIYSALQNKADSSSVPTKTSDLTNDSGFITSAPVTSVNGSTGVVVLDADDVGAAPAVTEVTVSTAGDVTAALDAGKIYHFTGAVTSLTLTLNAAASGQIAQYHFDFDSGSTAATITVTGATWQGGSFTPEASTHYEVDILNGYAVVAEW